MAVIFIVSLITNIIFLIVPIYDLSINFPVFFGAQQYITGTVNGLPRIIYAWKLKKLLSSTLTDKNVEFYKPILGHLEKDIQTVISGSIVGLIISALWMWAPVLNRNVYILYNLFHTLIPLCGLVALRETGKHVGHMKNAHSMDKTTKSPKGEIEDSRHRSETSGGSRGGSPTADQQPTFPFTSQSSMPCSSKLDEALPLVAEESLHPSIRAEEDLPLPSSSSGNYEGKRLASSVGNGPGIWNPFKPLNMIDNSSTNIQLGQPQSPALTTPPDSPELSSSPQSIAQSPAFQALPVPSIMV